MFDCIIPIGATCNITFLLENAGIKKQTGLFEWFICPQLSDITRAIRNIVDEIDEDTINEKRGSVFIGDTIGSSHYTYEEFKPIYQRRRKRFIESIQSSKRILFCRFEGEALTHTQEGIDSFIDTVKMINRDLEDIKLVLLTPGIEIEHPSLVKVIYTNHASDPYCRDPEINILFLKTLHSMGYHIE
jgi:predicted nucleotide-binding protein (sugar kinase/HSP70/actin superfamily)